MRVYLCEKPSQAADIARHVGARQRANGFTQGNGVTVTWCIGHLLEQAQPEHYSPEVSTWDSNLLPILPAQWSMKVKPKVKDQYAVVQKLLRQASEVVIATDADREGEVIAREVMDSVGYRGPVRRLWLGALDDESVRKGLAKLLPGEAKASLYASGLGRARADWLGGMNLTMALTDLFPGEGRGPGRVRHFGRVQTPVLGLIVRRERAIRSFVPKPYFTLSAVFEMRGAMVPMDWQIPADQVDKDGHCVDQAYVKVVATAISGKVGRLTELTTTPERESAPLPYYLGSLQKEAASRFGIKAQQTLDAAQALYEKHKATTYPRTDCEYLPSSMFGESTDVLQALAKADANLAKIVAAADLNKPGRAFNDKKITAHHAIIPTANPNVRVADMSSIERTIYDLIRRRYLAQFLGDFHFDKTVIQLVCEGHQFSKTGRTPTAPGWKRAYDGMDPSLGKAGSKGGRGKASDADEGAASAQQQELQLPPVLQGDQAINRQADCVKTQTKPPKRYTEATLLSAMEAIDKEIDDPRLRKVMQNKEKAGIGTDATRSNIIEGLFKREYIANEKKAIFPTQKGENLIGLMERVAPQLADPVLTALWEDRLSQIEAGSVSLQQFEGELGTWLKTLIERMKAMAPPRAARVPRAASDSSASDSGPVHACPACGKAMRLRNGASGGFWGCSGYPGCKTTLPDVDGAPGARQARPAGDPRSASSAPATPAAAAQRTASSGTSPGIASRSAGPARSPDPAAAKTCNACGKPMKLRQGSRGPFYGCTGYPNCRNILNLDAPSH